MQSGSKLTHYPAARIIDARRRVCYFLFTDFTSLALFSSNRWSEETRQVIGTIL